MKNKLINAIVKRKLANKCAAYCCGSPWPH